MIQDTNFRDKHPKNQTGFFEAAELESLRNKLPDDTIAFLEESGKCTYGNDFFWVVLPGDYYEMLHGWGLEEHGIDPSACYVFLRTSLGALIYFYSGDYYYLNPVYGENNLISKTLHILMNFQLSLDLILEESFCIQIHEKYRDSLPDLMEDEMYALIPAIPLGGSLETSTLEVVKMREQLAILAELYEHTVTED